MWGDLDGTPYWIDVPSRAPRFLMTSMAGVTHSYELRNKEPPDKREIEVDTNKRALQEDNLSEEEETIDKQDSKRPAIETTDGWNVAGKGKNKKRQGTEDEQAKQSQINEQQRTREDTNNNSGMSGFSGFEDTTKPVIKIQLIGENTNDFTNQYEVFQALSGSIFKTILIEESLSNINSQTLRFEVRDLKDINLDSIKQIGNYNVKCSRPLSDVDKDCSYGVIKGIDTSHDTNFIKANLRLVQSNLGEYLNQTTIKAVERCFKFKDGVSEPSRTIKITFMGSLPKSVRLFYHTLPVFQYNFGTMACKKCKEYGHTKNFCNKQFRCGNCSTTKHKINENGEIICTDNPYCFHCKQAHRPNSSECEVHQKAIKISKNNTTPNNKTVKEELKNLNKNPIGYKVQANSQKEGFTYKKSDFPAARAGTIEAQGTENKTAFSPLEEENLDDEDTGKLWLTSNSNASSIKPSPKKQHPKNLSTRKEPTPEYPSTQTLRSTATGSSFNFPLQQVNERDTQMTWNTQRSDDRMPFSLTPQSPIGDSQGEGNWDRTKPKMIRERTKVQGKQESIKEYPTDETISFWDTILRQATNILSNILVDYYHETPTRNIVGKYVPQAIDIVINIVNHFKRNEARRDVPSDQSITEHSI